VIHRKQVLRARAARDPHHGEGKPKVKEGNEKAEAATLRGDEEHRIQVQLQDMQKGPAGFQDSVDVHLLPCMCDLASHQAEFSAVT
jgi:hypothetical protein